MLRHQTRSWILSHNGLNDAESRKGMPFGNQNIKFLNLTPITPKKHQNLAQNGQFQIKMLKDESPIYQKVLHQ